MRIRILKNPYVDLDLPVGSVVEATGHGGHWYVDHDDLKQLGCKSINPRMGYYFYGNQIKLIFGDGEPVGIPASVESLRTRNAELLEAVKKAHEILLHEMDNGRTPSMLQGVGLGYFEDIIAGLDVAQSRRG